MRNRLLTAASSYVEAGLSVFPVTGKTPNTRVLPEIEKDGEYKRSWLPYQSRRPNQQELYHFFNDPETTGMAVACGPVSNANHDGCGLYIIDLDRLDWVDPYLDRLGLAQKSFLIQRTGRGGIQLAGVCRGAGELRNHKLAMYPNPDFREDANPKVPRVLCGIESRGTGGYACIDPSRHPNGNYYKTIQGSFENVPLVSEDVMLTAIETAQSFNQVTKESLREPYVRRERTSKRLSVPGLIIKAFMDENPDIMSMLEQWGYTRVGRRRGMRPDGKRGVNMPGVLIADDGDAAYFWSSNDPLNQYENAMGQPFHDSFGAVVGLKYGGKMYDALEGEGERLGFEYHRPDYLLQLEAQVTPMPSLPGGDVLALFGANDRFPIIFLTDTLEAAHAIEGHGVAVMYIPRMHGVHAPLMRSLSEHPTLSDRYVLFTRRDGYTDSIASAVSGKIITPPVGRKIEELSGIELLTLMREASDANWDAGIEALKKRT